MGPGRRGCGWFWIYPEIDVFNQKIRILQITALDEDIYSLNATALRGLGLLSPLLVQYSSWSGAHQSHQSVFKVGATQVNPIIFTHVFYQMHISWNFSWPTQKFALCHWNPPASIQTPSSPKTTCPFAFQERFHNMKVEGPPCWETITDCLYASLFCCPLGHLRMLQTIYLEHHKANIKQCHIRNTLS